MAIFSRKNETPAVKQDAKTEDKAAGQTTAETGAPQVNTNAVIIGGRGNQSLVFPRLSEKASALARLNKYVFKVEGKVNKVELRKALEKAYGVKIADINMVSVKGKYRRYGRSFGKMSNFKKAIVTLKPDSKRIDLIES
jgi:large subunit ribosomal protein L23